MKYSDKTSVYSQIAANIKRQIYCGDIELGSALNSVRSLAIEYEVTIKTIQNMISSLEEEGIVIKRPGVGTFVTQDSALVKKSKEQDMETLSKDFFKGMKLIGVEEKEARQYILGGNINDNN